MAYMNNKIELEEIVNQVVKANKLFADFKVFYNNAIENDDLDAMDLFEGELGNIEQSIADLKKRIKWLNEKIEKAA